MVALKVDLVEILDGVAPCRTEVQLKLCLQLLWIDPGRYKGELYVDSIAGPVVISDQSTHNPQQHTDSVVCNGEFAI